MDTPTKVCTGCGNAYPVTSDYFHRSKPSPDGFHPRCKQCRSAQAAARFQRDRERILEKGAEWKRNNPDKVLAQAMAWSKNHPERRKEIVRKANKKRQPKATVYARQWRETNREHARAADREYRTKNRDRRRLTAAKAREGNRERYRAYSRNRYALTWSNGTHTADDVIQQYDKQGGLCYWCSNPVNQLYHVDHVIPVSRGGSNSPENLVIACPSCNQRKSDLLPFIEWQPTNPLKRD